MQEQFDVEWYGKGKWIIKSQSKCWSYPLPNYQITHKNWQRNISTRVQFFVRLEHIRKCFTQREGIFVLEEFSESHFDSWTFTFKYLCWDIHYHFLYCMFWDVLSNSEKNSKFFFRSQNPEDRAAQVQIRHGKRIFIFWVFLLARMIVTKLNIWCNDEKQLLIIG